jgi:hypothetical protein
VANGFSKYFRGGLKMIAFNSDAIYVFPCARAGGSSLASEYNFTHLSGRVSNKTSYVIGQVNNILQVVLDGYYFEIKDEDIDSLCTKKLILWLETLPETDNNKGWSHVTRRVCGAKYDSNANQWIKLTYLDNLDEEEDIRRFSALYAAGADDPSDPSNSSNKISIETGLTYVCLDLNDSTNWMDNIHKGIEDKLVGIEKTIANVNSQFTAIGGRVDAADEAIEANTEALNTFKTKVATDYATKTELGVVDAKADSNTNLITNLTGRLDGIVARGGEPNTINTIKVNGADQEIVDKAVDIIVPVISETKVLQLNDGQALLDRTTSLETTVYGVKASEGVEAVAGLIDRVEAVTGAIAEALQAAKDYADEKDDDTVYNDKELRDRIETIEGDYLKEEDKYDETKLVGRVTDVEVRVAGLEAAINGKEIYAIAFDATDGTGTMAPIVCISDSYTLPTGTDIKFTPPKGKKFQAWGLKTQNEETGEYSITAIKDNKIDTTKTGNTILYAMWAEDNPET